jgi:hypothetical protein
MEFSVEDQRLMREFTRAIPRKTDGTGVSFIYCKTATAEHFGFDKLPIPKDYGVPNPSGNGHLIYMTPRKGGANNLNLRIAYEWRSGRKKPHMARFRLGGNPIMDTVQVMTNILNESGVDWLFIANANGNRLSRSCFHSDDVWGKGKACSG